MARYRVSQISDAPALSFKNASNNKISFRLICADPGNIYFWRYELNLPFRRWTLQRYLYQISYKHILFILYSESTCKHDYSFSSYNIFCMMIVENFQVSGIQRQKHCFCICGISLSNIVLTTN